MITPVHTIRAPLPNGHYSQAVAHAGVLYLSMQLPIDPATGKIPVAIGDQADVLFRNCKNILVAGGSSIAQILSATIFLADIADWLTMDRVFAANVGNHRPARGMVNVVQLHLGAKVGMQMTAAITP